MKTVQRLKVSPANSKVQSRRLGRDGSLYALANVVLLSAVVTMGACAQSLSQPEHMKETTTDATPSQSEPQPDAPLSSETSADSDVEPIASSADAENPTIQDLPDGSMYRFCSEPFSVEADNARDANAGEVLVTGLCYSFQKSGDRIIGTYYDTATLGEVGLCVRGAITGDTVVGKGREFIGSVGRQSIPTGAEGSQPVNWDGDGFLKVAAATVVHQSEMGVQEVIYQAATLDLSEFYRYPDTDVPGDCNL